MKATHNRANGPGTPVSERETDVAPNTSAVAQAAALTPVTIAEQGVATGTQSLPHLDAIQASFGRHAVTNVEAHIGGAAAQAAELLGAEAYATGRHVAFAQTPDLHTAAHEAAHVVQQRAGVALRGGLDGGYDTHEQHADAVADRVVRGESAEALLDQYAGSGGVAVVQRKRKPGIDRLRAALDAAGVHLDAALARKLPEPDGDERSAVETAPEPTYRALPDPAGVDDTPMPLPAMPRPGPRAVRAPIGPKPPEPPLVKDAAHAAAEDLTQASLEIDDARVVLQTECATQADQAQALTSHIDAFVASICADETRLAEALPKPFTAQVPTSELSRIEQARTAIETTVLRTHERIFTNPEFMRVLPHYRKASAPRQRIFGPSLAIIRQHAKGAQKLEAQQATLKTLQNKAHALEVQATEQAAALKDLKANGASIRLIKQRQSAIKRAHAKLAKLRTRIDTRSQGVEAQIARLDTLQEQLQSAAETARGVLIGELQTRIASLEKKYTNRTKLTRDLQTAETERDALKAEAKPVGATQRQRQKTRLRRVERRISRLKKALKTAAAALAKAEKRADLSELRLLAEQAEHAPMVSTVEQTDYRGQIDGQTYDLPTPNPGHLALDRPTGFGIGGTQRIPRSTQEAAVKDRLGIKENQKMTPRDERRHHAAMGATEALGGLEGRADSINTWDNVILTLGPGLTGSGVLQQAFWHLRTEAPAAFHALFGQYGVDVHKSGHRHTLSVVDTETRTRLKGKPARQYIANTPKLLVACRHAGRNKDWQRALAFAKAGYSIKAGVDFQFEVKHEQENGQTQTVRLSLVDVLAGAPADKRGMALAAIVDRKHAGGGVGMFKKQVPVLFMRIWAQDRDEDETAPSVLKLSDVQQATLAGQIFALIPANRRKTIREAFAK